MKRFGRQVTAFASGLLLVAASPQLAHAQDRGKMEVGGGYAYLHETDLSVPKGWFASAGGVVNEWLDVVFVVSGHYKTIGVIDTKLHTYVGGPKFASYKNPKYTPWGQVLFGGGRSSGSVSVSVPGGSSSVSFSQNGFDVQPGGGVDIRTGKKVGVRLGVSEDFIRVEGETNKEFQFIAGVVIRR
jgi:hypothetical protein